MTRVDFYILPDEQPNNLRLFACRLAEKAWQQGHRILIRTENADEARKMDDLLWTFRDGSFIPHALAGSDDDTVQPILISGDDGDSGGFPLLINMRADIVQHAGAERIAEIVNQAADLKQRGRAHYKLYRDLGHELHHHEMNQP